MIKAAVELDALDMTPGALVFRLKLRSERERLGFRRSAEAHRLGGASAKDWKAAMAE